MAGAYNTFYIKNYTSEEIEAGIKQCREEWERRDLRNCNIELNLTYDISESVHSLVLAYFSNTYNDHFAMRVVAKKINMKHFDAESVKSVVNWMYTDRLVITDTNVTHLIKIAHFLDSPKLLEKIAYAIRDNREMLIRATNSASSILPDREQSYFRPYLTLSFNLTELLIFVLNFVAESAATLTMREVSQFSTKSIYAVMAVPMPSENKVHLIFLAIDWCIRTRPTKQTMYGIIQSLTTNHIADRYTQCTRFHIHQYLTKFYSASQFVIYSNGMSLIECGSQSEIHSIPHELLHYPDKKLPENCKRAPEEPSKKPKDWYGEMKQKQYVRRNLLVQKIERRNAEGKTKTHTATVPFGQMTSLQNFNSTNDGQDQERKERELQMQLQLEEEVLTKWIHGQRAD